MHGDLKPENVFVGIDGRVKILDFGLATLHGPLARRDADGKPAALMGTVSYMAPEQLRGEGTDGRTDLFALGVVLHEMLTGRRPFEAGSTVGTIERILTGRVASLSDVDHGIPQAVSDLVDRCLAKAAADRLGSADLAVTAIESALVARQPPARASLGAFARRPVVAVIGAADGGCDRRGRVAVAPRSGAPALGPHRWLRPRRGGTSITASMPTPTSGPARGRRGTRRPAAPAVVDRDVRLRAAEDRAGRGRGRDRRLPARARPTGWRSVGRR